MMLLTQIPWQHPRPITLGSLFRCCGTTILVCLCMFTSNTEADSNERTGLAVTDETAAIEFLDDYNDKVRDYNEVVVSRHFAYFTDSTQENYALLVKADRDLSDYLQDIRREAASFEAENFSYRTKRRLEVLLNATVGGSSVPMLNRYSQATACLSSDNCFSLDPDLTRTMAKSRDYNELYWAWNSWREAAGQPSREDFKHDVMYRSMVAEAYEFTDAGALWRSLYEVNDLEEQIRNLYTQIAPLYTQLHAYVRRQLYNYYGPDYINLKGPIPAHLLGNMWAQRWINIFDIVRPHTENITLDLDGALRREFYSGEDFFRTAENFFVSLGMLKAPKSFWDESMFARPKDGRKVVCHGSAWDFRNQKDYRISMCTDMTLVDFIIAHHEMGHIQYYMQYADQPIAFRRGANPGFHEAVGDVIALSVATPEYHRAINLIDEMTVNSEETDINFLMSQALDRVAMVPFSFVVDSWRWRVFDGSIQSYEYNSKWWELRRKYQGVTSPTPRTEADFDPAAKFHISASVPYVRYFVSSIIQFQFHKALCNASGHMGPLFRCNIYNSTKAGDLLTDMLRMGSSEHWTVAMKTITGQTGMRADALLEYFKPLSDWLERQNVNETLGWDLADEWYPKAPKPWYGQASCMQCSLFVLFCSIFLNSCLT